MPSLCYALIFTMLAVPAQAWAQGSACRDSSRAKVAVTFEGNEWSASWAPAARSELATEIDAAGLCEAAAGEVSVALIRLGFVSRSAVSMSVSAGAGDARRSVERGLDLSPLPSGQWAFAVGVSASELLREAREVIPVLRPPEPPEPDRLWSVMVRGNMLFTTGGVSLFGAELSARRTFARALIELNAVVGLAAPVDVSAGKVSGFGTGGSLMVGAVLLQSRHLAWDAGALLDVRVLSMTGVTTSSELLGSAAATAVVTPLGVTTLWFSNGPFLASLRAGLGGVVRGGSVRADGAEISAFRGVAVLTSAGAGVRW